MINNSVSKAYFTIDSLSKKVQKAEIEGVPKNVKPVKNMSNKKGLLARSKEMFKYNESEPKDKNADKEQQKLVIAYVIRIRQAFEEVKNGRATNTKS